MHNYSMLHMYEKTVHVSKAFVIHKGGKLYKYIYLALSYLKYH